MSVLAYLLVDLFSVSIVLPSGSIVSLSSSRKTTQKSFIWLTGSFCLVNSLFHTCYFSSDQAEKSKSSDQKVWKAPSGESGRKKQYNAAEQLMVPLVPRVLILINEKNLLTVPTRKCV